jgi:hypothetical protein
LQQESEELDDNEFQGFVLLRRWRLLRARELGIETYKIFQNRSLCEMIRRRRNDATWARAPHSRETAADAVKSEEAPQATGTTADQTIFDALTDCWGVGPSKAKEGGFAWEALEVLNGSEIEGHLAASRSEK